jgi:CubicO group peptidase (beta-lactamase class C family)
MVEELPARFRALSPIINEIIKASGCPGGSVGILHHGKVIFTHGFGFRDVAQELVPDENTIYNLASLTKTFTVTMIAILVERGRLEWTTPISQILPKFRHWDPVIQSQVTITDWLCHRTGLAPKNHIWNQEFAQASLERSDAIPVINYLEKLFELRSGFQYNNWGYAVADEVITTLNREFSFGTVLQNNIFRPLGMKRTITKRDANIDNRAEPYFAMSDGSPHHLPRPFPEDGKVMQGAVAVQSCVHDLLIYYNALLTALADQTKHNTTTTKGSPLVQVPTILKAHIPMFPLPSKQENNYALAWARTELPAPLGSIGLNPTYVPSMPIVGKGLKEPTLCLWHQGSNNSFLSFVALLPETQSGVVVLTNALANNDAADWIGQLLLETLLDNPDKNDYLSLAKLSAANSNARWPKIKADLAQERIPDTFPKALDSYIGRYYNKPRNFHLEIGRDDESLTMCFQGNHDQWYTLEHNQDDIFTWVLTRNENARRGRFPVTWRAFYKLKFEAEKGAEIDSLVWENDGAWSAGERFARE